jgi:hypothetical protein
MPMTNAQAVTSIKIVSRRLSLLDFTSLSFTYLSTVNNTGRPDLLLSVWLDTCCRNKPTNPE